MAVGKAQVGPGYPLITFGSLLDIMLLCTALRAMHKPQPRKLSLQERLSPLFDCAQQQVHGVHVAYASLSLHRAPAHQR